MATSRAPKQWALTKQETITSYEAWRHNLQYTLALDHNFAVFLLEDTTWLRKTSTAPLRGLENDGEDVPEASRRTAAQKLTHLELMLGQVANYCPVIARNTIVKNSTSMRTIRQAIRAHYGFQSTGAHFVDYNNIRLEPDERPEDLYQRLLSFIDDNLLTANGNIQHHGEDVSTDEELTPSLENIIVLTWLRLIHADFPTLVKQRYGTELRSQTLASLKPEISQALDALLDEIHSSNEGKVLRTALRRSSQQRDNRSASSQPSNNKGGATKCCRICKQAKRSQFQHYLNSEPEPDDHSCFKNNRVKSTTYRVSTKQFRHLKVFHNHQAVQLTLDTGAETSMIKSSIAQQIGATIQKIKQTALQADGITPLSVVGEVHLDLSRNVHTLHLDGLVVNNLDVNVLAGTPFIVTNDISIRPSKQQITIKGTDVTHYNTHLPNRKEHLVRRTQAYVLQAPPTPTVIWPGAYLEIPIPREIDPDSTLAVEPRPDCAKSHPVPHVTPKPLASSHSSCVTVDPDNILPPTTRESFRSLLEAHDDVFDPTFTGYNGAVGPFEAVVNMGPVQPPQRKGRVPQYARNKLVELQQKFDELEAQGVFKRPEDIGITVDYLNPSFLVTKPTGGHRLVTAFADVGRYSKLQTSLLPDVDTTLRTIAQWKYIIVTDLSAFYQIPLSKSSMKYCGVATPFRGIRAYTRCAMGMPGSETALEELMCRVLGDCLQDGITAKLADDLYGELTHLKLFSRIGVASYKLFRSPSFSFKDHYLPPLDYHTWMDMDRRTSIGQSTSHCHVVIVTAPDTVRGLRSFIGAYKVLGRVLPKCSRIIAPLKSAIAGQQSGERMLWTDTLREQFRSAQTNLTTWKSITLPQPSDQLWIVTDGSVTKHAGTANVPSDFASRNAAECNEPRCQICNFVALTEDSVVRSTSVQDIRGLSGLPFTTRSAWIQIQSECPELRRTHAHLKQGTRPSEKITNIKDVKRYLNVATMAKEGLLVVHRQTPLSPSNDMIIVPRTVLNGLVTALHIKLDHPSKHQLQLVMKRQFYALDMLQVIDRVCETCHTCASLRKLRENLTKHTSENPPDIVGVSFAADVLYLCSKSFWLCLFERRRYTPTAWHIHRDRSHQNSNKNPVAEKAIAELEGELNRQVPNGGPVTELGLAITVSRLNARLRREGISADELWTQRNQFTHEQLPLEDRDIIINQHKTCRRNHPYSGRSKNTKTVGKSTSQIHVGDLIYLPAEHDKTQPLNRYLVVSVDKPRCFVRKFSGNQLRALAYKVRISECHLIPSQIPKVQPSRTTDTDSEDDGQGSNSPFQATKIPPALTLPGSQLSPHAT
ncbi:Retrovirus-related Pol poly from transposon opus [Paramuricea clavata]|uniref:Retrovirus-related Pol poly from transposon opus n=1 Tax=Paramuricea clavata TaxID=317549 RepID=A0A6S7H212_PARCT|nr:Retrovirus-related Pol poly from transposon opus [Paramuricea clavata]